MQWQAHVGRGKYELFDTEEIAHANAVPVLAMSPVLTFDEARAQNDATLVIPII